jgi:hypothetical protein
VIASMRHPEFAPVFDLADMDALDMDHVLAGYRAGLRGDPPPTASYYSRAYWHGWRNGAVDGGHAEKDAAQAHLAHLHQSVMCRWH